MSRDVRIRSADGQDIDAILPLFTAYRVFYGMDPRAGDSWVFLVDRLADGSASVLLAEDEEGAGLGFALCYPSFDSLSLAPQLILHDLFVEPEARGHGIGRALLDAVQELARETGACAVVLQTAHDNTAAQSLYRAAGYRRDEVFDSYRLELPA